MNIRTRIEALEERASSDAGSDRRWREMLNNLNKVYGDGQPLSDDAPVPTPDEFDAIIAQAYAE